MAVGAGLILALLGDHNLHDTLTAAGGPWVDPILGPTYLGAFGLPAYMPTVLDTIPAKNPDGSPTTMAHAPISTWQAHLMTPEGRAAFPGFYNSMVVAIQNVSPPLIQPAIVNENMILDAQGIVLLSYFVNQALSDLTFGSSEAAAFWMEHLNGALHDSRYTPHWPPAAPLQFGPGGPRDLSKGPPPPKAWRLAAFRRTKKPDTAHGIRDVLEPLRHLDDASSAPGDGAAWNDAMAGALGLK